ncbi:2OG-Fe(II) oxygenase [Streptomyces monticola]|uniref:2OG-Fe(II) oxygenase n=1 Tax=Streptomyces monticola TaxID=2666263 RepID=A0ABW2JEM8_9ACTN
MPTMDTDAQHSDTLYTDVQHTDTPYTEAPGADAPPTDTLHAPLLDGLANTRLRSAPWRYAWLDRAVAPAFAAGLAAAFPSDRLDRLDRSERRTGDKTYRLGTHGIDLGDRAQWPGGPWPQLLATLACPAYTTAVARLTGVDLSGARLAVSLWEYGSGDWLAPHVDKADKLVTQILYLSAGWTEEHGGRLLVLDGPDTARTVAAHAPLPGSSAVLVRSRTSWHAVESPASAAPPRRSLTATFLR